MISYFAGWDGGGTGTTVECIDLHGKVLTRGSAGPLNPNGNTSAQVLKTLCDGLHIMAALPGGLNACGGLCISAAGISNQAAVSLLQNGLAQNGYQGSLFLCGDHESALHGALNGKPGIILISGTGSICYGHNGEGKTHRCGGWGQLIDDEGSGYAIGRDVLSAVVQAEDGRMPPTLLREFVFEQLQISSVSQLITHIYQPSFGKHGIASLAPLNALAAAQKDEAALAILQRAAKALYSLAHATAKALALSPAPIVLSGSILQKMEGVRTLVLQQLSQSNFHFLPHEAQADAAHGAALLAKERAGKEI